ncbi:MAG: DNA polymerase III subunit alpha, partial [Chloroflexi bacterium]|nr:DNA polymerase III subunit alpha [Chloroflexota bacterium]
GSAAASAVLYCLDITEIDPLRYDLVFERFLNLERKEMPDIDLDIEDERRAEVLEYTTQRFGRDRVAQIITFGTLGAKAAIRDVGRALAMPLADVDRVARLIPSGAHPIKLSDALRDVSELREIYDADPKVKQLIDSAKLLEGVARHASTHAAGVVISREPLVNVVPLQRPTKGGEDEATPMTQWDMDTVAKVGLLKMDFLGLSNLTTLARTRNLIAKTRGETIDLQNIPLEDTKTFDLLCTGETTGLFQLEGSGMRRWIKQLKPRSLADVSAMIALYRPGPMEHIPRFIESKHGTRVISHPHPDLAETLAETYGVIVYQDQVLQIARRFAGYTLGEADVVRKAMGKKIASVMAEERSRFVSGALAQSYSHEDATAVFDLIEPFAGYAFNKAHSVSYAYIAYQTAYFKANYAIEYMTSLFNSHLGDQEKAGVLASEATSETLGIEVSRPDINRSGLEFTIESDDTRVGSSIRTGLAGVKNVGHGAVEALVAERDANGIFTSLDDLIRRADTRSLNRRAFESLARAGAFDDFGPRKVIVEISERVMLLAQREQRVRESQQGTMFDLLGGGAAASLPLLDLRGEDVLPAEKAAWEREYTGITFTAHVANSRSLAPATGPEGVSCGEIDASMEKQRVLVAGLVSSTRQFAVRGEPALSAVLQDLSGSVEVTAWPDVYRTTRDLWVPNMRLLVRGRVRVRDGRPAITCESVEIDRAGDPPPHGLALDESRDDSTPEEFLQSTVPPIDEDGKPVVDAESLDVLAATIAAAHGDERAGDGVPSDGWAPLGSDSPNGEMPAIGDAAAPHVDWQSSESDTVANPNSLHGGIGAIQATPPDNQTDVPDLHGRNGHGGPASPARRVLVIRIAETADVTADVETLNRLFEIIQRHPGDDRVRLHVSQAENAATTLDLPLLAAFGPELALDIAGLLGEGHLARE